MERTIDGTPIHGSSDPELLPSTDPGHPGPWPRHIPSTASSGDLRSRNPSSNTPSLNPSVDRPGPHTPKTHNPNTHNPGTQNSDLDEPAADDLSGDASGIRDPARVEPAAPSAPRVASPPLRNIMLALDSLVVLVGWLTAFTVATSVGELWFGLLTGTAQTLFVLGAGIFLLSASGLYRRRVCAVHATEIGRIGRVSVLLTLTTVVLLASTGRESAILAGAIGGITWFVLFSVERSLLREWIHTRRAAGDFGAPVVVIGGVAPSAVGTAEFLDDHTILGFDVRGIISPEHPALRLTRVPWLGPERELEHQVVAAGASGVVLDSSSLTGEQLNPMVQRLASTNLHVHISSGLRGIDSRRITVSPLADETFLHVAPTGLTRWQLVAKRALDLGMGSVAMLLLLPVLGIAAAGIWLTDRGPVLFRQERVGLDGQTFRIYKLRTMVVDAEARKAELAAGNERDGPLFKVSGDPRVTNWGRFLRASSIDEIPQLYNVLRGEMSLVGPRPALPDEVAQFDAGLNQRLRVKPGVTGLWQVEARDLPSFDLYRRYDLLYVQNWSLGLDLVLIVRTAVVVLLRTLRALVPARLRSAPATSLE